jgi:uncharacterized protein DUF6289
LSQSILPGAKMRRTAAIAALVLTSATAAVVAAAPAQALPQCPAGYQCNMIFYSNASHTTRVGGYTYFCSGEYSEWGVRSSYQAYSAAKCPVF